MNISKDTIARTIILILAMINQAAAILGKGQIDITDDQVYQVVTLIVTIGSSLVCWWKNNSFTKCAIYGDNAKAEYKAKHAKEVK